MPEEPTLHALRRLGDRVPDLRAELRLHRHLLEQPPPHVPGRRAGRRCRAVGQPAPAVLAVAVPVHHRVDGRDRLRADPDGRLRASTCCWRPSPTTCSSWPIFAAPSGARLRAALGRDLKGKLSPVIVPRRASLLVVRRRPGWRSPAFVAVARRSGWSRTVASSGSCATRPRGRAGVSHDRSSYGGEEYVVRRVTGSAATKPYRCPGLPPGDPAREPAHRRLAGPALDVRLDGDRARRAPALAHGCWGSRAARR